MKAIRTQLGLVTGKDGVTRCAWVGTDPQLLAYHDRVWGRPCHRDRELFEQLSLECLESGLGWKTILTKQKGLEELFAGFDPQKVAAFSPAHADAIAQDPRAIRLPAKIHALIWNARLVVQIENDTGTHDADGDPDGFARWLWGLADQTGQSQRRHEIGFKTSEFSDRICHELRQKGFRYVGSVSTHSFLQACGIINSHYPGCAFYNAV
jgi:DNA-3-methyladenine glycosylase I